MKKKLLVLALFIFTLLLSSCSVVNQYQTDKTYVKSIDRYNTVYSYRKDKPKSNNQFYNSNHKKSGFRWGK